MASRAARQATGRASTLTEWLRQRTDEQLAELLRLRPDLGLPAPSDLPTLASRVGVRTSVQRAIDGLDAFTLRVLEALVLTSTGSEPAGLDAAAGLLGKPDRRRVATALEALRDRALVWGEDDRLYLVAAVVDAIGPYPAGLGRPAGQLLRTVSDVTLAPVLRTLGLPPSVQPQSGAAVRAVLTDPDRVAALIAERDPAERDVLERLAAGPPVGVVRDAVLPAELADGATPPHRLILHGLLVPIDAQTVELPREVGLALRGPAPLGPTQPDPPAVPTIERTPAELDRLGTTAVLEVLRRVESLGSAWTRQAAPVLRSGGVGARELRRTAKDLDLDEASAALLIEVAAAAGLVAATHGVEPVFLPTPEYDTWRHRDAAVQWTALAGAWLAMTRQPSLVGQRDERDRLITPLGPDAERGTIPGLRRQILQSLGELAPGHAPADRDDVLARLAWQSPRRASAQRRVTEALLAEADTLGITAAGGLTGYGRALLAGAVSAAEDALAIALPVPVDHFLVQPDLTVVVPGPPDPELAEELALAAELESTGGASVYRITESSIRRALDSGRSGADLSALFAERSRTPVPQALSYLIDDVARRHGLLRTGAASAYLRCDDESLLSRVVNDRAVDALGLRRLAPTVVVSTASVPRVLEVLRAAGYAPSAEAPDGAVLAVGGEAPRAPSRPPSRVVRTRPAGDSPAHLAELVRRMRSGDQLAELSRRVQPTGQLVPGVTTAATLGLLRQAIRDGSTIWLGYVDSHGTASQRTITPISMAGGTLRGHDTLTGKLDAFALHHITAVSVLEDE